MPALGCCSIQRIAPPWQNLRPVAFRHCDGSSTVRILKLLNAVEIRAGIAAWYYISRDQLRLRSGFSDLTDGRWQGNTDGAQREACGSSDVSPGYWRDYVSRRREPRLNVNLPRSVGLFALQR